MQVNQYVIMLNIFNIFCFQLGFVGSAIYVAIDLLAVATVSLQWIIYCI